MKQLKILTLITLLLFTSACQNQSPTPSTDGTQELQVHFIDVGQADSALLQFGEDTMLIDGGNVGDSSLVVSYLTNLGIDQIDHVVCTHAHEDHVGGLSGPMSQLDVANVYSPVTEYDTRAFGNFAKYAEEQGLSIISPDAGDSWMLGDAEVTVLGPLKEYEDPNNTSLILKVVYEDISFLFTGDAERQAELDMLDDGVDLSATVLKAGHHGSDTSTSYQFLREVDPEYTVISLGVDNKYGHPDDTVLSRFRDADVSVYRTDLQGTVVATTDGESISFTTDKGTTAVTNPTVADKSTGQQQYIGNTKSDIFHYPECISLPSEKNRMDITSRESAISQGFLPCGRCNP